MSLSGFFLNQKIVCLDSEPLWSHKVSVPGYYQRACDQRFSKGEKNSGILVSMIFCILLIGQF